MRLFIIKMLKLTINIFSFWLTKRIEQYNRKEFENVKAPQVKQEGEQGDVQEHCEPKRHS